MQFAKKEEDSINIIWFSSLSMWA